MSCLCNILSCRHRCHHNRDNDRGNDRDMRHDCDMQRRFLRRDEFDFDNVRTNIVRHG